MGKYYKLLFVLIFLISILIKRTTFAQTEVTNKWYITTVDLLVSNSDTVNKGTTYRVRSGTKFTVINVSSSNNYEILFGFYGKTSDVTSQKAGVPLKLKKVNFGSFSKQKLMIYPQDSAYVGSWANFKTFYISPKELSSKSVVYYTGNVDFTWGALTLPLKIRFGNGKNIYSAYEENLNLGLTFGLKYTIPSTKEQYLNALVMAGISSVTLDSVSLKSASYYDPKNTSTKAVSYAVGLVYQYSTFQIGAFFGVDHISGELGRQWLHQDKPWLGIGIGLALFNNVTKAKSSNVSNSVSP